MDMVASLEMALSQEWLMVVNFTFNPLPPGGIHAHAMACLAYIPGGMCIHDIFIRKQEKVLNWKVIMNNKRQSDGTQKKKNRMFYT